MALQPPVHADIAFQNLKVADLLMSRDKCWNLPANLCTVRHKSTRQVLTIALFYYVQTYAYTKRMASSLYSMPSV